MNNVLNISRGKIAKAQKVIIYGPEGIGKSTFLSHFPGVIFIDTEDSTANMDVYRTPKPTSWTMLLQQITALRDHPPLNGEFKTLALDTADWAEKLCMHHVCNSRKVSGIEDFGYGKGYTYAAEEFGKLLNLLNDIRDQGINIAISAHAMMRKFEQPDELGAYDRWELKCDKRISSMLKEWADMVLFANYETYVVASENKMEKKKVQGGRRVMYTTHHACWDAKNRFGLSEKLPLDFNEIAACIYAAQGSISASTNEGNVPTAADTRTSADTIRYPQDVDADGLKEVLEGMKKKTENAPQDDDLPFYGLDDTPDNIPKALADLMNSSGISMREIQHAVASKGFYPDNTPFEVYDRGFVEGVLIAAFDQVKDVIMKLRETEGLKHEYN